MERGDYEATKTAYIIYGAFFQNVVREIGWDRALALHCEPADGLGRRIAADIEKASAEGSLEPMALSEIQDHLAKALGIVGVCETTDTIARERVLHCPLYDGLRESGMEHEAIEALCRAWAKREYAALQEECPKIKPSLEFRDGPDGVCVEEWELVK